MALHKGRDGDGCHITTSSDKRLLVDIFMNAVTIIIKVFMHALGVLIAMPVVRTVALEVNPVVIRLIPCVEVHTIGIATIFVGIANPACTEGMQRRQR